MKASRILSTAVALLALGAASLPISACTSATSGGASGGSASSGNGGGGGY